MVKIKRNHISTFYNCLKILYPIPILFLILIPFLVGAFVNYSLLDTKQIGILLAWLPLFTIPLLLTKKTIFYYIPLVLYFLNGFVVLGSWVLVKHPVTSSAMFVAFNTNLKEAIGFTQIMSSSLYLLVILYVIIFIVALFFAPKFKKTNRLYNIKYYLSAICGIIFIVFMTKNVLHNQFIKMGVPSVVHTMFDYEKTLDAYQNLKNQKGLRNHSITATSPQLNKPQVFLLIMGESTNRNHMSLYGYYRKTNPLLSQFNHLIVYDNVISGYTHTIEAVPTDLSAADLQNKKIPANSVTLAEVMQSAGYKTYWLSNQPPVGVWNNLITLFAQQYEVTVFVNSNSSVNSSLTHSYDQKLFRPLKKVLKTNKKERKFIVMHLMGTHGQYSYRYPPEFNRYIEDTSAWWSPTKIIASYDNAIRYNDFVIDSILQIFKNYCNKNNAIGATVYLSDHSENVYDEPNNSLWHNYGDTIPKTMVEIPFIVWLSHDYREKYPLKTKTIELNVHQPYISDDLFHSIIDLTKIKTPIFNPKKSVFNQKFNNKRKRILIDGNDYDR